MRDETLVEPFAVSEIYVDGFTEHAMINGNMSCVGFRIQPPSRTNGEPQKVIVVRLVWPAASTEEAIMDVRKAQSAPLCVINGETVKRH